MDTLTRDILTQIQAGKSGFQPSDAAQGSITDFQPTAKRIEWARKQGYINDVKYVRGSVDGSQSVVVTIIAIIGGLTLEGEQFLLGDEDYPID